MVAQYATKLWLSGWIKRKFDSAEVLLSTTQIREIEKKIIQTHTQIHLCMNIVREGNFLQTVKNV